MAQHHLAEEDTNFLTMSRTNEHPVDLVDDDEINEHGDPLAIMIAREDALSRIKSAEMTPRNERIVAAILAD